MNDNRCIDRLFYQRTTHRVAQELVGKKLVRLIRGGNGKTVRLSGIIVETEAYGHTNDPASHSSLGRTLRNAVMFGDPGRAYVYFTYGNHFCVNVSAKTKRAPAGGVLIRALQPVEGIELMEKFRNTHDIFSIASGPGKLTRALQIDRSLNGIDMTEEKSVLRIEEGVDLNDIVATTRIGITRAVDKKWRFLAADNPFISRKPVIISKADLRQGA